MSCRGVSAGGSGAGGARVRIIRAVGVICPASRASRWPGCVAGCGGLAWFGPWNPGREPGPPGEKHTDYTGRDIPEGGSAIPYWMEDPFIRQEYEATLKANGVQTRMDPSWYVKPADADAKKATVV